MVFSVALTVLSVTGVYAERIAPKCPRAVVTRWLELHRTGKRDEATALTAGSSAHRADVLLPSTRDTGVRVARSLDNGRVAAVVTSSLDGARDGDSVLLFWLARQDGAWRINKSDSIERRVVDERLRGFLEAGNVRWHVQCDQLLGHWESGPCRPPGMDGITACGSRLQLWDDNRYRLLSWGPGAPDPEDIIQGEWQVASDRILLSHQDRTYECPVSWMGKGQLEIASADGKIHAAYESKVGTGHSMKGWELHVWRVDGAISYSLMVGTNRIKSDAEIADSAVDGFMAITMELDELKKGESVVICGRRLFDEAPAALAKDVAEYCERIGLGVQVRRKE